MEPSTAEEPTQAESGTPTSESPSDNNKHDDATKVILTGFPTIARAEDLMLVLKRFGTVTLDKKSKKFCILKFKSIEEARAAVSSTTSLTIYGESLSIVAYSAQALDHIKKEADKNKGVELIDPSDLNLTGDFYQQLDLIMASVRMTREDVNKISQVYVDLENVLQVLWPGCQAVPFGSITTGLGVKSSDADCFVLIPAEYRHLHANYVTKAKRVLQGYPQVFTDLFSIPQANTPIVKFFHVPTSVHCDVSFKTPLGVQNSKLIAFLLHADPRLIPLCVAIKYWAKVHGLTGTGKMTNYALTMMIIFYLQQPPVAILPTVEWLQRDQANDYIVDCWNTGFMSRREFLPRNSNTACISELFGGFFQYYAMFDFDELIVCPYLGIPLKKTFFADLNALPEAFQRYKYSVGRNYAYPIKTDSPMCVQDPIEQSHNVACTITCRLAADIKTYFKFAATAYEKEKLNNCQTLFKTILLDKPKLVRTKAHPEYRMHLFPRTVVKITEPDWKTVVRDIVFIIYEKMLKIKLGKIEEKVNPDSKKEKEKYMGILTKPIWKRKNFTRLYNSMKISFESKQEKITEELIKVEKGELNIQFQLTLTFCHKPRSAVLLMRLSSGVVDAYKEFGKFFILVMQSWFEELLKPHIKVQDNNVQEKIEESVQLLNEVNLDESKEIDLMRQIFDNDECASDSDS